jgi:hypothetical protein
MTIQVTAGLPAHLAGCRRQRPADAAGGRLLYLLCSGAIVVPFQVRGDSWRCVVVAGAQAAAGRYVTASAEAVETALAVPMMDPFARADVATFVGAWQARVWHHWPVGQVPALAPRLTEQMFAPARTVDLHPAAVRNLLGRYRLHRGALRHAVTQLAQVGLLTEVRPAQGEDWGRYTLALAPLPVDGPDAVRCPARRAAFRSGGR